MSVTFILSFPAHVSASNLLIQMYFQNAWQNDFLVKQRGEGRKKAIAACEAKQVGDSCKFEGRRGKVEGTCRQRKETLICIPIRLKKAKERAIEACKGKKVGDSCQFEGGKGQQINGSCKQRKENLICLPYRRKKD